MPRSHAGRLYDRAKRGLERKLYGEIGKVPDRTYTLPERDFTQAVSSGAGREGLRRKVGLLGRVDWEGSGRDKDDHLLTSGAGRREYQRRRKER